MGGGSGGVEKTAGGASEGGDSARRGDFANAVVGGVGDVHIAIEVNGYCFRVTELSQNAVRRAVAADASEGSNPAEKALRGRVMFMVVAVDDRAGLSADGARGTVGGHGGWHRGRNSCWRRGWRGSGHGGGDLEVADDVDQHMRGRPGDTERVVGDLDLADVTAGGWNFDGDRIWDDLASDKIEARCRDGASGVGGAYREETSGAWADHGDVQRHRGCAGRYDDLYAIGGGDRTRYQ